MSDIKRREFLKATGGVAAAGALGTGATIWTPEAHAQWTSQPEKGAKLRVLRWKRFVQGDEDAWMANTKKFSERYGVEVRVDHEGFEDVRPKAAVAANVGSGPDIIVGWFDDPHQYPDKLVPLTDLADYLGKKYGGWYDVARAYGMRGKEWIGLPLGCTLCFGMGLGPSGLWWGLCCGLFTVALGLLWMVRRGFRGALGRLA